MALSHTDTPVPHLKINKFTTLADFQAATQQSLIDSDEISFIEEGDPSGGGGVWGSIQGTLSDQTDLQNALDNKENLIYKQDNTPSTTVQGAIWIDTDENYAPSIVPIPTSGDSGKILSVNSNGAYTLITVVNAENIAY